MSLALSLCQYVLRSRRGLAQASPAGLAQASPSLKAPRLQAFEARDLLHQHNRKGQVVMIKTRRSKRLVFGFVFCTLNLYEFWRRSGGLPCSTTGGSSGGGGSLLSAGFIIWAMSGWVRLSRRIRVISRVNAAGSSTSSFASASGLSRTMAMSISPPSL